MSDQGMVLLSVAPETKEKYVISVGLIERRQKFLKLYVQELLDTHSGEIKFSSFEDLYKDKYSGGGKLLMKKGKKAVQEKGGGQDLTSFKKKEEK
ncbi:hypothetical protein Tco_0611634 [Tanacetum coccineum]